MAAGDIWAAVGHSSQLVPLALRHGDIALVAPSSGTALWSDVWAVPRQAGASHKQVEHRRTCLLSSYPQIICMGHSGDLLISMLCQSPRHQLLPTLQVGPSPLLPAWMLYGLEPTRASRKRGLQGGASPLLLPGAVRAARCRADTPAADSSTMGAAGRLDLSLGERMPSDEVLERSEFLEPLQPEMADLYWKLLQPLPKA